MHCNLRKQMLIAGFLIVCRTDAQMVLTESLENYNRIPNHWEEQDRVGPVWHGKAITEIPSELPPQRSVHLREELDAPGVRNDSVELLLLYIEAYSARRAERMGPCLDKFTKVVYGAHATLPKSKSRVRKNRNTWG